MMSHYYMLMLAPLFAFVRADFAVSYTELALALTVFNVVSGLLQTPVGFLVDRIGARVRADRGACSEQHRLRGRRHRRLVLGVHRHVRRRRPRQHGLSSFRLFAAVASRAAGTAEPGILVPYLRRHGRLGDRAGHAALYAKPVRLARRLLSARRIRLAGVCSCCSAARTAGRNKHAGRKTGADRRRGSRLAASDVAADPAQSRVLSS
jgi:hypothetical protein